MCQPERGHLEGSATEIEEQVRLLGPDAMFSTLYLPPDGRRPIGGVVAIHDVFGHRNFYQNLGRRLAYAGFAALVPDLFFRQGPIDPPCDEKLGIERRARLDETLSLERDLPAASELLRNELGVDHITGLGFCMGGTLSMLQGSRGQVDAVVTYYGFPIQNRPELTPYRVLEEVEDLTVPLLGFWGTGDVRVDLAGVAELDYQLTVRGRCPEVHVWPDLPHGFLTFDPGAEFIEQSTAAWERTLTFMTAQATASSQGARS
jgi:carboxymethylenebutenolidase